MRIAICIHHNLRKKTLEFSIVNKKDNRKRQRSREEEKNVFVSNRRRNVQIVENINFTSGAIQYGLPLKESIEEEEFI